MTTTPLQALCAEKGIAIRSQPGLAIGKPPGPKMPNNWRVQLRFQNRAYHADFFGGSAVKTIDAADVLCSLCSDARGGEMSFEDFCGEFGYDTDSRRALALHEVCVETAKKLRVFLGADFEAFCAAEH